MKKALLTMNETCEALGICRNTIYKLIKEDRLKSIMLAGSRRITVASVEALIAGEGA